MDSDLEVPPLANSFIAASRTMAASSLFYSLFACIFLFQPFRPSHLVHDPCQTLSSRGTKLKYATSFSKVCVLNSNPFRRISLHQPALQTRALMGLTPQTVQTAISDPLRLLAQTPLTLLEKGSSPGFLEIGTFRTYLDGNISAIGGMFFLQICRGIKHG